VTWVDRIAEQREVGVVVERHALASRWATHRWHAGAVLLEVPDAAPWTKLAEEGALTRFYAGPATLTLVPSESESYLYNLGSREPQVWVILRPRTVSPDGRDVELEGVTVAAGEAEVLAGGIDIVVESVPMPEEIAAWVSAFVEAHPAAPKPFKRRRSRHVSEGAALAEQAKMKAKRDDE
jgi:hypothetical protein